MFNTKYLKCSHRKNVAIAQWLLFLNSEDLDEILMYLLL